MTHIPGILAMICGFILGAFLIYETAKYGAPLMRKEEGQRETAETVPALVMVFIAAWLIYSGWALM